LLLGRGCCHLKPSSADWLPVQSFSPAEVWPLWVRSFRFAVGLFLGCAAFLPAGFGWRLFSFQSSPLFGFGLRFEFRPAIPSQPTAVRRLLSWAFVPFSTSKDRRSTSRGLSPPATFRLQGLDTLLTVFSLRSRAGSFSHRQRSWDSPFGAFSSREVSEVLPLGCAHLPFHLSVFPPP
jgi:hypothetical protein